METNVSIIHVRVEAYTDIMYMIKEYLRIYLHLSHPFSHVNMPAITPLLYYCSVLSPPYSWLHVSDNTCLCTEWLNSSDSLYMTSIIGKVMWRYIV